MSALRTLALTSSILLVIGACKGKPKAHQAPATAKVETPATAGSASSGAGSSAGSGAGSDALALPHGPGTPPVKTTAPLTADKLRELSQMTFPGFLWKAEGNGQTVTIKHETISRPKIRTAITITACNNDCTPMDLAKWKAKEDQLKETLIPELRSAPDTVFEIGQTDLHGQPMIYTYQLAQMMKKNGSGAYSDGYVLYYNDGVNQIRVFSSYVDDPVKTKEDMAKIVPKEDLEKVSKAFMDVYTHAWAP